MSDSMLKYGLYIWVEGSSGPTMGKKARILFVCTDGLPRCQMAEGFTRYFAGANVVVGSAGSGDQSANPYCHWAMNEAGIDVTHIAASPLEGLDLSSFSYVVTLSGETEGNLATVPSGVQLEHWRLPDPTKVRGNPQDLIMTFRAVRNATEKKVKDLLTRVLRA
jgi:arsenate reductase